MSLRDLLKGTGVALVTPFKEDTSVDYDSLRKLIDFVIAEGVDYLVTLGTTGETPTLSREEKIEIIQFTFTVNEGRVPVVVGIGGNDTRSLIKEIETFPLKMQPRCFQQVLTTTNRRRKEYTSITRRWQHPLPSR